MSNSGTMITRPIDGGAASDDSGTAPDTSEEEQSGPSADCTVCLEPAISAQGAAENTCGHIFHLECIAPWLKSLNAQRFTCPNCRQELSTAFLSQVIDFVREEAPTLTIPSSTSLQFSIHIPDDLNAFDFTEDAITYNDHLAQDLEQLMVFTHHQYLVERQSAIESDRAPRWRDDSVDAILTRYQAAQFPRTDYVTRPTLIRLTVVAALIHLIDGNSSGEHRIDFTPFSIAFARLLAHGDTVLLDAQREARAEAVGTAAHNEYRRVLDHGDWWLDRVTRLRWVTRPVWRHSGTLMLAADQSRARWVLELRIRTRGRGAEPMGPGDPAVWRRIEEEGVPETMYAANHLF